MIPAAIAKAESLSRYCKSRGSPLDEVTLILTLGEGYELLDYIAAGGIGTFTNHDLLVADCHIARRSADPFMVLHNFQLCGLSIARADVVLN